MKDKILLLEDAGVFTYGNTIEGLFLREEFGLPLTSEEDLEKMSRKQATAVFNKETFAELGIVTAIRKYLMCHGKYLSVVTGTDQYRVPSPSENASIIKKYYKAGSAKLQKADDLSRSTPTVPSVERDNIQARIALASKRADTLMKERSI
jgi:hypothetical protein